jgi:hypothetical protein
LRSDGDGDGGNGLGLVDDRDGGGYVASDGNNAGEQWSQQWHRVGDGYDEDDGIYDD